MLHINYKNTVKELFLSSNTQLINFCIVLLATMFSGVWVSNDLVFKCSFSFNQGWRFIQCLHCLTLVPLLYLLVHLLDSSTPPQQQSQDPERSIGYEQSHVNESRKTKTIESWTIQPVTCLIWNLQSIALYFPLLNPFWQQLKLFSMSTWI